MKVLIIGLGSIARKHIRALREIDPACEIYALRSNPDAIPEDETKNLFSWDEAFNLIPYEFAIISNRTRDHGTTLRKLISFNCPLLIEKPVLADLDEARELGELLEKNKIATYVACNLRFHPCLQFMSRYLEQNRPYIQETTSYCGSYLPEWRPGRDFRSLYSANKDQGGGAHLDLIHELDYLHWLFGFPKRHERFLNSQSNLGIDAVDYAHYVLDYGTFFSTVTLNYFRRMPRREFEIVTEKDVFSIDLLQSRILKNDKEIFSAEPGFINTYKLQLNYFLDSINSKTKMMNDFSEAVRTLKICIG